jgi:hypothetical protein
MKVAGHVAGQVVDGKIGGLRDEKRCKKERLKLKIEKKIKENDKFVFEI